MAVKVRFKGNTVSEVTKINYWNGQEVEVDPAEAERFVAFGMAEYVEGEQAEAQGEVAPGAEAPQ